VLGVGVTAEGEWLYEQPPAVQLEGIVAKWPQSLYYRGIR
jgi:ATP-dependent DNA ligase